MPQAREVAIIGGGPAGSICAERLSRSGFATTLYDEHLAWEKPCGGGLTQKALAAFPFLLAGAQPKKPVNDVELIASDGARARFHLDSPIVIFARTVLNGLLLDRAAAAGCDVIRGRVTRLETEGERARLETAGGWREADFVVIAAGARNSLLPCAQNLPPEDLELTLGYYIPAEENLLKVKFVKGLEGYLWSFPRLGHLSVGICASMHKHGSRQLRALLDAFVKDERLDMRGAQLYSHVLPSPRRETLCRRQVVGHNWALAGDAAAWVDPVTGEGIYYAMRSGEILAEALIANAPEEYPARVQAAFRHELEQAAKLSQFFYHGKFLGGTVTSRMIAFARHSATFRQMLADVFAGSQSYRTLKTRLWSQLGITLVETAGSLLRPAANAPAEAEA
ncbi:MAG TPA: NAD(P)/FAD-dependent oxidoreductase [Candidatus Acidoferrales bacterium]|nr:NAD(P)/FAD-dependent oxidoreductase [Candidatus Acidoferrales bacterium]